MAEQKHILIVDDDIELGALLAKAVADMSPSYTVKLARDVDEAMVQIRRSQTTENMFDLVITDIKMTGLNGLELLEALHALVPDLRTIAMTAYTSSEIAGRADELGVQAYLTKPFMISEFRSIVRSTLDAPVQRRPPTTERPASPTHLKREEISRALASLRTMTAADAVFLLRNDGTLIEADAREPGRDVASLGSALQVAQRAITVQMTRLFDQSCAVRQSFFGTDAYSVCTYRIDGAYTAAVVFGPEVREGQVWYYIRDAAATLSRALGAETPSTTPARRRARGENVLDMLDRFFPSTEQASLDASVSSPAPHSGESKASPVAPTGALVDAADPPEDASPLGLRRDVTPPESSTVLEAQEPELLDPSIADGIDFGSIDGMSWDTILEETDKGWEGITLEEARRLGLIDDLEAT